MGGKSCSRKKDKQKSETSCFLRVKKKKRVKPLSMVKINRGRSAGPKKIQKREKIGNLRPQHSKTRQKPHRGSLIGGEKSQAGKGNSEGQKKGDISLNNAHNGTVLGTIREEKDGGGRQRRCPSLGQSVGKRHEQTKKKGLNLLQVRTKGKEGNG